MWRPFYLQLWVLVTFSIAFTALIAVLEALLIVSNHRKGLTTVDARFQYAWAYGPTAVFTIIALIWGRVTFQIQMLAPWNRMKKSSTRADEGLLLDYLDMLPPLAIIRALKHHDWAPAAAKSIYLVLQVLVTLSTSLLEPHITQIESSVPLELKNRFNNTTGDLALDMDLTSVTVDVISELRFPYPESTTAQYAYQTLKSPPSFGTDLRLEVDGFSIEISHGPGLIALALNVTFEVRRDDCSMMLSTEVGTDGPRNFTSLNFVRMLSGSCNNSSFPTLNRTSIVVGRLVYSVDNPHEMDNPKIVVSGIKMINSVQSICAPRYDIITVGLSQNGTSVRDVSFVQEPSLTTLDNVKAWDFILAQINIISGGYDRGQIMEIDLGDGSAINFNVYTMLTRSSELHEVPIPRYFQKLSAQIAQQRLLEPVSVMAIGNQTRSEDRLIIAGTTCHAMTALIGFCALLSIVVIVTLPRNYSMNKSPASILGTAWTATEATPLLLRLRDQGLGKSQVIRQRLGTAAYLLPDHRSSRIQPLCSGGPTRPRRGGKYALTLHPASRALFLISLGGSIIILEALLRLSQNNNVAPSIFFTTMASVASSIDGVTRSLVPFLALKKGSSFAKTIDFELLDGSIPRTALKGLRARSWPVVFTIAAFSVSSTFTIFSGLLYVNQANTTFGEEGKLIYATGLPMMGSYQSRSPLQYLGGKDAVASVPAVRSRLQCKLYSEEQIRKNLTMNYIATEDPDSDDTAYRIPNPLRIDIDGENCLVNHSIEYMASAIMIPTLKEGMEEGEVTFGVSSGERYGEFNWGEVWVGGCSKILYAWGRVAVDTNGESTVDAFALGCNETVEVVDTEVHFNSTALTIDSSQPPVPDEDSARLVDFRLGIPHDPCYNGVVGPASTDSAQVSDPFFALLISSPWAIPAPDLTNATTVDKVVEAIRTQHGLVRANQLDTVYRVPVNDSTPDVAPIDIPVWPKAFVYSANATILPGRPRVVQDLQSTRMLQTLLAVTLVLSLIAWCLTPRTDIIVGSPTSIARMLALAAGGNLFEEVLSYGVENLGLEKLRHREDCKFIIGWRSPDGSMVKKKRFGIWALTAEEVEEIRVTQAKGSRWTLWKWR
ncbi:hypothetical protein F5B21DRAFT_518483 [Xylaria acuta]|nr:hypothetical protein F5B21DRAFT_518483 [Xylaria acuta]